MQSLGERSTDINAGAGGLKSEYAKLQFIAMFVYLMLKSYINCR